MIIYTLHKLLKKANSSHKSTFFMGITTFFLLSLLLCGSRFLKKKFNFSGLRSRYDRLENWKKLNLPLKKYLKSLKDMTIGTESFTVLQSGRNNGVEI